MKKVLVTTDFTPASRHGLDYACMLLAGQEAELHLLHILPMPVIYAMEGAALYSIPDATNEAESLLAAELYRVRAAYPQNLISGQVAVGSYLSTLRHQVAQIKPDLLVLGTAGFNDFSIGNADPLNALRSIPVPVLFVPHTAPLKPIRHFGYACNLDRAGAELPLNDICRLVKTLNARLSVVHVDSGKQGAPEKIQKTEAWVLKELAEVQPEIYREPAPDVLDGIRNFLSTHPVDCLISVPRRYGVWEGLFHRSRTKALARRNTIPLLALHPKA